MIIVTGGAGFIGSALVWALNERGEDDILIVDHLGTSEKWKNLRALRYADYMEKDDFLDCLWDNCLDAPVSCILHMGACSATTEKDASYLVRNNFDYTKQVLEYAAENDIRVVYASSAATYGDGSQGYRDDETALDALRPLNMYGYSKQMADQWALRNGHLKTAAAVKFSNVFGPNEQHKGDMRSMVSKAWKQIRAEGKVKLFKSHREEYADGEQVRDFVYVKDAVAMTLFLADNPERNGIFNVGCGAARSWNDLATAVFKSLDKPVNIEYVPMPEELRGKYQYHTELDMSKMREAGFSAPVATLEDAVADYVRNYLEPERLLGD
jgi:ADP-L-glycero-D-manno-heptose 6-epimerase